MLLQVPQGYKLLSHAHFPSPSQPWVENPWSMGTNTCEQGLSAIIPNQGVPSLARRVMIS